MDIEDVVDDILEHHGVKGMKWGVRNTSRQTVQNLQTVKSQTVRKVEVRRAQARSPEVTIRDGRKKIKTSGGKGLPAHEDALRAREIGQRGKGSGLKTLSDKELKDYANRLQLEANVHRLNYNEKPAAERFVANLVKTQGSRAVKDSAESAAGTAGKSALALAAKRMRRTGVKLAVGSVVL